MIKHYEIAGMKYVHDALDIKEALLLVPDITDVTVKLGTKKLILNMKRSIDIGEIQEQLLKDGDFTILEIEEMVH